MANIFDALAAQTFATVAETMGYDCKWLNVPGDFNPADFSPSDFNTSSFNTAGRVLFKGPTNKEELISAQFAQDKPRMEYFIVDFPNLEAAAKDNQFIPVYIDTIGLFNVASVQKLWDGKTMLAYLEYLG